MPIDSNIALSVKPVQIQNPLEQYAQVQQIQQAQNHNRLADLMFSEKQRELAADNALAALLSAGKSGVDITSGLASQGFGNKAIAYTKQLQETEKQKADIAKINAEAGKFNADAVQKKLDIAGQAFGFVRANPTLENANAALDYLAQHGLYTPEQVAQSKAQLAADPSKIASLAEQAFRSSLSAKDQLAKIQTNNIGGSTITQTVDPVTGETKVVGSIKNTVSPDAVLQANTSRANNAATVAATIRGQDKPTWDSERGVFVSPNGTAVQVNGADGMPLAAKDKLTESQGKSTAFAARMQNADSIINDMVSSGVKTPSLIKQGAEGVPLIGGALGVAANKIVASPAQQKMEQAQRDFVNAVLRQESGAAISASEFDNARKQYFPQPGDSSEVIQQKAQNRRIAIEGMKTQSGPGAAKIGAILQPKGAAVPANAGIKFLGFE